MANWMLQNSLSENMKTKFVYSFAEGTDYDKGLLGAKGATLSNMFKLKIPIPPGYSYYHYNYHYHYHYYITYMLGFIITTEVCNDFIKNKWHSFPKDHGLIKEYTQKLYELERVTGRQFGGLKCSKQKKNRRLPLLLSIRTAATYPNPTRGLMSSILNVGINDEITEELSIEMNNGKFAYQCYYRFVRQFGINIIGVNTDILDSIYNKTINKGKKLQGNSADMVNIAESIDYLSRADLILLIKESKAAISLISPFPDDPFVQLLMCIEEGFRSTAHPWATQYRQLHNLPENISIIIQSMVFGNVNSRSGTGIMW